MLTAGAAKLDITPHLGASLAGGMTARPAVDVHDPLHVRCVVLGDGETDLALVCCDLIVLSASDVACVKRDVRTRTGISPERVLICATHTHTGPSTDGLLGVDREEDYMAWAVRRMADVVVMAQQRLRPASAGWGSASLPGQVFNRRYRMSDGTVRTNPGVENPDVVEPAGPTDPEIGLLVMRDGSDGTPIAAVGNYALHYVGGGDGRSVSADYFAVVEQALNREKGHAFPVLWTNGCSGDINNVDVRTLRSDRSPYGQMVRVAEDVAREALGIWSGRRSPSSTSTGRGS